MSELNKSFDVQAICTAECICIYIVISLLVQT